MSELTLTIIRLGLLVLLWVFVFSIVGVLRGDLYGTRIVSRSPRRRAERTRAATALQATQRPSARAATAGRPGR